MDKQTRIEHHKDLHKKLDTLLADFMVHTGKLLSETSVTELLIWSYKQTILPDDKT